jgi:hypothetical protein
VRNGSDSLFSNPQRATLVRKGGVRMRKGLLIVPLISLLFFGCASREYVKQQMEPLLEKMSKIEKDVRK